MKCASNIDMYAFMAKGFIEGLLCCMIGVCACCRLDAQRWSCFSLCRTELLQVLFVQVDLDLMFSRWQQPGGRTGERYPPPYYTLTSFTGPSSFDVTPQQFAYSISGWLFCCRCNTSSLIIRHQLIRVCLCGRLITPSAVCCSTLSTVCCSTLSTDCCT